MVAEIQRFEDAARIAMGDYSQFGSQTPARVTLLEGFALAAARVAALLGRAAGKHAA